MHILYGSDGLAAAFRYKDSSTATAGYYYMRNATGDITGIVDVNGNVVVEYTYDAWGNPLSITGSMALTLGKFNPLRFKGYVYDE